MADIAEKFLTSLDQRIDAVLDACTACGACASVCPTPNIMGIGDADPVALASGVLDILRGGPGDSGSEVWATSCCGSGFCLTVCEHGINPRFMLAMARRALNRGKNETERREAGRAAFQKMSRGVRILSRLQLPPEILARINPRSHPERDEAPDLIFYTGCNLLKTPHIGLLCLDVLERLGVTYEVHGGPANCCGILQYRPGDTANAGRQAFRTIDRFAKTKTSEVLAWCPTCQIQFGEVALPSYEATTGPAFDMTMFPVFLRRNLDKLRPHLTRPVNKRVAVHEYSGGLGVVEAVNDLLAAIPGLEVVDLGTQSAGYTGTALAPMKDYMRGSIARSLRKAEEAGVDTFVGIYHSDHREFSAHEAAWTFTVANYMELIGESMGLSQPDVFKQFKLMGDVDAILASAKPLIEEYDLDPEEVREVVLADMLGDQHLPVDRDLHPADQSSTARP